jgi:preprotein translocase subunit Sss1
MSSKSTPKSKQSANSKNKASANFVIAWFQHRREDWNRIITVAKKPDKETYKFNLRITGLIILIVGLLSFAIQAIMAYVVG